MGGIIWGNAYLNTVSNHDLDSVLFHPSGKTAPHDKILIAMNFNDSGTQNPGYLTF